MDDVLLLVPEVGEERIQGMVDEGQFVLGEFDRNHGDKATVAALAPHPGLKS
jgi:hypothetical protein